MSFAKLDNEYPSIHLPRGETYTRWSNSEFVKVEKQRRLEVFAAQGYLHTKLCADGVSFQLTKSTFPSRAEEALHLQDDQFIHAVRHRSDVIGLGTYWADFYHSFFLSREQTIRPEWISQLLCLLTHLFSLPHTTHILTHCRINRTHSRANYNTHSLVLSTRYNHET